MDQLSNVLLPGCQWDNGSIGADDYEFLSSYLTGDNIIEFGPGMSTVAFARAGHSVISIEANRKWHGFWKSALANFEKVTVLYAHRLNQLRFPSKIDMVFVDAPHGNRMLQCQWAARHCNHWLLHDARINVNVAEYFFTKGWDVNLVETKHGIYIFTR